MIIERRPQRVCFGVVILAIASVAGAFQEPKAAGLDGGAIYRQFCAICHGAAGQGSELGSTLMTPIVMRKSDRELTQTITEGRVDRGMPAFGRGLKRDEIASLVAYLRGMQREARGSAPAAAPAPAPVEASDRIADGEAVFRGKAKCASCHSVFEAGGWIGPDLSRVAETLTAGEIYEAISFPSVKLTPGFAGKVIVMKDGRKIRGRYRGETDAIIQAQDSTGELWTTLFKKDIASAENDKTSLMPEGLLKDLSESEVKDLLAFLSSLK